ncbi:uncharacterized protein MYCGRDRAFT_105578 [Zymoseptoria tritici IPO323]|uniref:Uncharacterized protein n=1 Tax=Zymoseptoria tritici (strain CBS 115943 / IPO323) TaxID=336722 RepID=F9XIQ9_ZYMTI|nr:uncharacterized protein MYCGRDRAFT_105578 [Zymoseptoria tritici IPO323]EGP85114.1 hypothetical protein MYCGRDRAFT_105578 [Zymoseptoria tritici IPO323]
MRFSQQRSTARKTAQPDICSEDHTPQPPLQLPASAFLEPQSHQTHRSNHPNNPPAIVTTTGTHIVCFHASFPICR